VGRAGRREETADVKGEGIRLGRKGISPKRFALGEREAGGGGQEERDCIRRWCLGLIGGGKERPRKRGGKICFPTEG